MKLTPQQIAKAANSASANDMKPSRRIVLIAVAAIAIVGAWSYREERRSPCASGACRLPLLLPVAVASTNETPQPATTESLAKP